VIHQPDGTDIHCTRPFGRWRIRYFADAVDYYADRYLGNVKDLSCRTVRAITCTTLQNGRFGHEKSEKEGRICLCIGKDQWDAFEICKPCKRVALNGGIEIEKAKTKNFERPNDKKI